MSAEPRFLVVDGYSKSGRDELIAGGAAMAEGYVAGLARFNRQGYADQAGLERVERGGLGVDGHGAGTLGQIDPALQGIAILDQLVCHVLGRLIGGIVRLAGFDPEPAFDPGDDGAEVLGSEKIGQHLGVRRTGVQRLETVFQWHVVAQGHQSA